MMVFDVHFTIRLMAGQLINHMKNFASTCTVRTGIRWLDLVGGIIGRAVQ
jgi:hypothetical protein